MSITLPHVPSLQDFTIPDPLPPDEHEKYHRILDHFAAFDYTIPGIEENGKLTEQEMFWLTHECFLRYLRGAKWEPLTAIKRLEETLKWRREFDVYEMKSEHVEPEAVTGKEIIFGYDLTGRPALYLIPSRQNTDDQTRQIQYTIWMLERCVDLMDPGVGSIALLINFADRAKNPSLGTARKVLNILQSHYPERLGLALIINVPFLVMAFLNLIFPFVDPVTRQKIKFNPKVVEQDIIAADQVMKEWGGSVEFEYKHEQYWAELVRLCKERRERWLQNWRTLGGKIGTREWDIKQKEVQVGSDVIANGFMEIS